MAKTAILSVDILADASKASAGFDEAGKAASSAADKIESVGDKSGTTATGLSAISGALDAAGFGPAADAIGLVATGLDAAEGSTMLFKVAQESLTVTTIKDTAAKIANTVQTTAANIATKAWAATQWLLNAALSANPLTIIIIAVLALIAVIVLIATKTTFFQDTWEKIWPVVKVGIDAIKKAFGFVSDAVQDVIEWVGKITGDALATFKKPIDAIKTAFDHVSDAVSSLIDWVGKIKMPKVLTDIIDGIKKVDIWPFAAGGSGGGGSTAPTVSSRAMSGAPAGGGGVTFNVMVPESSDPVATARYLKALIRRGEASGVIFGRV